MTPDELLQEVRTLGHSARVRRGEVQMEHCPSCGNDRWNMELNADKRVYHCWACGDSGVLAALVRALGGEPTPEMGRPQGVGSPDDPSARREQTVRLPSSKPVAEVTSAMAYLRRRGIVAAEAERVGMAVCIEPEHPHRLRIMVPLQEYWTGRPVGYVSRSYLGDKPKYLADVSCEDGLPGWRSANVQGHVLCEGPFDALAYARAGFGAACLLGLGRRDEAVAWAARVPSGEQVVVSFDAGTEDRLHSIFHAIQPVHENTVTVELREGFDPADLRPEVLRRLAERAVRSHSQEET